MKINLDNYEAFFLDFHEGALDTVTVAEVMLFLDAHPELREEFEEFDALFLEEEPIDSMPGMANLKKTVAAVGPINEENFEDFFIRETENQLSAKEKENVAAFVATNPDLARDHQLYQNTTLVANEKLVFAGKSGLKKSVLIPLWSPQIVRVAATVLLLLGSGALFFLFRPLVNPTRVADQPVTKESKSLNFPNSPFVKPKEFSASTFGPVAFDEMDAITSSGSSLAISQPATPEQKTPQDRKPAVEGFTPNNNLAEVDPEIEIPIKNQVPNEVTQLPPATQPKAIPVSKKKEYLTVKELLAQNLRGKETHEEMPEKHRDKIRLADMVNGLARKLKSPFSVNEKFDENGELLAYEVGTKKVNISRKVTR